MSEGTWDLRQKIKEAIKAVDDAFDENRTWYKFGNGEYEVYKETMESLNEVLDLLHTTIERLDT